MTDRECAAVLRVLLELEFTYMHPRSVVTSDKVINQIHKHRTLLSKTQEGRELLKEIYNGNKR